MTAPMPVNKNSTLEKPQKNDRIGRNFLMQLNNLITNKQITIPERVSFGN